MTRMRDWHESSFRALLSTLLLIGQKWNLVDFPIGKKFFHLVVNPGAVPVTRRNTKMAAELVDEEVEILFGFDEEEDINVVAATSTFNSLNNPEQTTQRYVKPIRNGSHHFWISHEPNKSQNLSLDRNCGLPKRFPCRMLPVAATSLHSFCQCASGHLEGVAKKTNCALVHEWRLGGSHFVLWTGRDRCFCRGPGTGINYQKRVNWTRNSVRNVPTGKTSLPVFRFSPFSGDFPVGRTDETFSIYRRTERRATTSLIFVHSDIGGDTQGIENSWWPRTRTSKELFESNLRAGVA